jgi:hypothetical protein
MARLALLACLAASLGSGVSALRPSTLFGGAKGKTVPVSALRSSTLLNVHIIPHSHDDLGWLVRHWNKG